jgi:endonuclease/exonuclease/phosphatase family metal-dependent hydrolase
VIAGDALMRAWLAALLLVVPAFAHGDEFTIATFNTEFLTRPKVHVKFGFPFDLEDQAHLAIWAAPGFRDQKFSEGAAAVAKVVASIKADVIVLTEVGDERDVRELTAAIAAEGVNYPHLEVCACTDTATRQHVAVLSRFPLNGVLRAIPGREGYFRELDDADSEDDTGISKGILVSFEVAGRVFQLYGLHLASERGGNEQDQQRIAQASIVRRHSLPAINAGGLVIVAGDLNDGRGEPTLRRIRGLDDIWPDLIQTGDYAYFKDTDPGSRWTYEFQGERNQIDHILISASIKEIAKVGGIKPRVPDRPNRLASDHRPFVLTLDLR